VGHRRPEAYWDAADLYERANGRLYVSADFALPRDLGLEDQLALAREFAHHLTDDEQLPYTLAIHVGRDADDLEHNPHAHLMFSERQNDGIERSRDEWFRRANSEHPERGGAPKSRTFHGPEWIEQARERWADLTNKSLERSGRTERVDHLSYERQGIDREPGEHYGPSAAHMVDRGEDHDRLEHASSAVDDVQTIRGIESQIARLEAAKETLLRHGLSEDERQHESRDYSHSHFSGPTSGESWER
jgi:MobA/MobL family